VNCRYKSIRGEIISNWHIENNIFYLDASVPGNTTARIFIPAISKESVFESDIPATSARSIKFIRFNNNYVEFEAGSGKYHFRSALR
jgi:alpha-L-rhamnosidase